MPTPFGTDDYSDTIVGIIIVALVFMFVLGGLVWAFWDGWSAFGVVFSVGWGTKWLLNDVRDNWEKWR